MGGFIGATEDGVTTTLGRGGSDYTAAIVGAALAADEIQIWTDVDGMLTCDPRVVPGAHCLRSISYAEAEQMAKAGAKVLHPATVLPAIRQGIPIVIRNSRNPGAAGTRIVRENPCDGAVMSIACRTGIALLQLVPRNTPVTADFGSEIWDAFQKAGVAVRTDRHVAQRAFRRGRCRIADAGVPETGSAFLRKSRWKRIARWSPWSARTLHGILQTWRGPRNSSAKRQEEPSWPGVRIRDSRLSFRATN